MWQTELMLQVTWCSRLVRINPPQSIPEKKLHQLCPIRPPIAPGIIHPKRNQTQNQRSTKLSTGSAIKSPTLLDSSGGSGANRHPIAPGIIHPKRNQTQNQRSTKLSTGSAIKSPTLLASCGGSGANSHPKCACHIPRSISITPSPCRCGECGSPSRSEC